MKLNNFRENGWSSGACSVAQARAGGWGGAWRLQ